MLRFFLYPAASRWMNQPNSAEYSPLLYLVFCQDIFKSIVRRATWPVWIIWHSLCKKSSASSKWIKICLSIASGNLRSSWVCRRLNMLLERTSWTRHWWRCPDLLVIEKESSILRTYALPGWLGRLTVPRRLYMYMAVSLSISSSATKSWA